MGECIGLDFGTTYSMIAELSGVVKNAQGELIDYGEPVSGGSDEKSKGFMEDTLVAISPQGIKYSGKKARGKTYNNKFHIYQGFKMLLSERGEEGAQRLRDNGFESEEEPAQITQYYLSSLIEDYKTRTSKSEIEKIVVGVPEVWFQSSPDSRNKLEAIVEEIVGKDKVQLESEPKLACTYFVQKFKKETGKAFFGNILLIDYGGGTLDITVCHIEDKNGKPEISIIYKTGAGANEQKRLGNAGLAYMQTIIFNTLDAEGIHTSNVEQNSAYYRSIDQIENQLLAEKETIRDIFEDVDGNPALLDESFTQIIYDKNEYEITYGDLEKAYQEESIEGVFKEKLYEVLRELDKRGIIYNDASREDFKIALVGGFCNFYLVQRTVEEIPGLGRGGNYSDLRYKDFDMYLSSGDEREKAIAYGAALMANGVVTSKTQAPYTLSILPFKMENGVRVPNKQEPFIIFNEYDEIKFDHVYWAHKVKIDKKTMMPELDEEGHARTLRGTFRANRIPYIMMSVGKDDFPGQPSEELILPEDKTINIGFSLDHNYILSLHVKEAGKKDAPVSVKRLTDIYDLLGGLLSTEEE